MYLYVFVCYMPFLKKIIWLIVYIFIIKILFDFKCTYTFKNIKITTRSILLKIREKKLLKVVLNLGKNFKFD